MDSWDEQAQKAALSHPLKVLKNLPNIPDITKETKSFLQWRALKYILQHDKTRVIPRYLLKHPFKYTFSLIKSYLKGKPYTREGDFFFYGLKSEEEFKKRLKDPNSLLVVGFSYCHKPFECPSGRFTDVCHSLKDHPVCQQCFIGKMKERLPKDAIILSIPTIHYIGEKILEFGAQNPTKKILFLITACALTLEMFGHLGKMAGASGIGVRLGGRICNTMKAFDLSEKGIKPGLTVVLPSTQERMLSLFSENVKPHQNLSF